MRGDTQTVSGTGIPVRGDGITRDQILPTNAPGEGTDRLFAGLDGAADLFRDEQFRDATVLLVNSGFGRGDGPRPIHKRSQTGASRPSSASP